MRKLILKLTASTTLRKLVKSLGILAFANWCLHCFPIVKTLPGGNIRYRARRIESLALSVEMFDNETVYKSSSLPANITSFADLGCNVGYFTCWLANHMNNRELKGLMVDANSEAIEDARWHAETNKLSHVHALHGLVGIKENEGGQGVFYLHSSNVCSSATPPDDSLSESHAWKKMQIPCISVEKNWLEFFGDIPCDLLKIDVEGAEIEFFANETKFLKRVKSILVEWHKWKVSLAEVEKYLSSQDFHLQSVLADEPTAGTAIFSRINL
jgi:FkbM family methyltransferase